VVDEPFFAHNKSVGVKLDVSTGHIDAEELEKAMVIRANSTIKQRLDSLSSENSVYTKYGNNFSDELAGLSRDMNTGHDVMMSLGVITSRYYDVPVYVIEGTVKTVCMMKYNSEDYTSLDKKQARSVIDGFKHVACAAWDDKKKS
jgi:hypothetical protein